MARGSRYVRRTNNNTVYNGNSTGLCVSPLPGAGHASW
ncbi:hypothetical protein KPSA1_02299 [Pseudomonas syringae pv. actinidiae]|uniref:Uncharacterized protein n=1 Tax=Pseudomonas syringae pv. actinidiae TaxID=103796 RepID=A0A2V0Q886_PSESF|nr:hypothetical protein KPSA1_02299 [Pseudomonas syringae pv. actinidiae]GBH19032.1 hypothetical protein KPSA3_05032 [Pseudomonas syringae pv. actinidiae]